MRATCAAAASAEANEVHACSAACFVFPPGSSPLQSNVTRGPGSTRSTSSTPPPGRGCVIASTLAER